MRTLKFTSALALLHALGCGPSTLAGEEPEPNTETTESGDEDPDEEPEEPEPPPEFELGEDELAEIIEVSHELELIVAGAVAYFEASEPPRCPHPEGAEQGGEAGFTPMDFLNCNLGPDARCVPSLDPPNVAGYYDYIHWSDNSVWEKIGWQRPPEVPHAFHYNFSAINLPDGSCTFTAEAIADFDDDFVFSSYSISGSLDHEGAVIGPLEIVDPFE